MSDSTARSDLLAAFQGAVARADPASALRRTCERRGHTLVVAGKAELDLREFANVWVVGAGKAVVPLANAAFELLGDRVSGLSLTTRHGHAGDANFDFWEAGHPRPDANSLAGAADALHLVGAAGPNDLVVCLLTGGASSLWAAPVAGIPLGDLRGLTDELLRSGATIQEINCVRKHVSRVAGGRLAAAAAPARIITFALSDVIGNQPDAIASGPTVPDPTTYEEALTILAAREVPAPSSVMTHLQKGAAGEVAETPKPGALPGSSYHIIASLFDAVEGATIALHARGYEVRLLTGAGEGDAAEIGRAMAEEARSRVAAGQQPLALIWGGESTVRVTGSGKGGRNQQMALASAIALAGSSGITIGCFATDGSDGPTNAAGAFADSSSVSRAKEGGLDPEGMLQRNDAYTLFSATGDLIITGPTGTNVNDLAIALIE